MILSYCLDYTRPNNVSVFMCYVMLPTFLYQQRFLSFQAFHVGLMSELLTIRLWHHHETYFPEMFTPGTYNN